MTQELTTRQTILNKLKELNNQFPNLTRRVWREESGYTDIVYEKEFGSFLAFKQAADIEQSPTEKKILSATVRHAKIDVLDKINEEKSGYAEKYLRPNITRFQTVLTGSDLHDKLCDPFYRRTFIDTATRVQPEKIVLAGDVFDLFEFSKYTKDPRKCNIVGSIRWVHTFLSDLRNAAPNSEIIIISGNHENRLLRYLSEQAPSILPVLSDIHGMTVSGLLGLDQFEVNYISRDTLGVFTETDVKREVSKNYYIAHDAVLFHHFPYAKDYGYAGFNGHHHTHKVDQLYRVDRGPYEWHQLGAGHVRAAEYCEGAKWSNGFALAHIDTYSKAVAIEYIDVTQNHAIIGGKWYTRTSEEIIVAS